MLTTGFKLFFGLFAAFAAAALVYGYASGGGHVGPISLGWKGGVGDHIGYGVLVSLAAASLAVSLVLVAFRDADSEAQAALTDGEIGDSAVSPGFWPVAAAFGAGTAVVGLVLHPLVFGIGLVIVILALVEWTMDAWADQATGDPAANRELRNRVMAPVEIPILGALAVGVVVLAASRILIAVSALWAVAVAGVVSALILVGAFVYATRPGLGRRLVAGLGVVAALGLLVGGVLAAVNGERDFPHHGDETHHESGAEESGGGESGGGGSGG